MSHDEKMKKLEKLYEIAVKTEDVWAGLAVFDEMTELTTYDESAKEAKNEDTLS